MRRAREQASRRPRRALASAPTRSTHHPGKEVLTMLSIYNDWDSSLAELRRQMSQLLDDFDGDWPSQSLFGWGKTWPRVNLADSGDKIVLTAEIPGLSEKDIQVSIEQDVLC